MENNLGCAMMTWGRRGMGVAVRVMVVFVLLLAAPPTFMAAFAAAPYALEIIQPAAGLDTKNRFYKAYPGFVYVIL